MGNGRAARSLAPSSLGALRACVAGARGGSPRGHRPDEAACPAPMAGRSLGKAVAAVSVSVALAWVAVRAAAGCRRIPAYR